MVQIVDASVAIKWFIKESGEEEAFKFLERMLEKPSQFAAPEIFFFELAHVFNRLVQKPNKGQTALFEKLLYLPINRFSMTPELYKLICQYQALGLSGYDSSYVALAKMLQGVWITSDEKAHAKIEHLKLSQKLGSTN